METACVESDDFYDAPEEISSVSDSESEDSDELQQVGNNGISSLHYDFWSGNPKSIDERRDDFIRRTGFVLDRCQTAREGPDDATCVTSGMCNDRTESVENEHDEGKELTAGVIQEVVDGGDQGLLWRIQSLDDRKEFDVENEGIASRKDNAAGVSSRAAIDEFHTAFGTSNLFQQTKTKSEENGTVCKKKPQCKEGWLKRFSFKAANMFNKDKDHKELLQKCKSLGYRSQRVRVRSHKKWSKELSSLYRKQEFSAHKGSILAMKFSLDGQYLATGGEDGTLNVWKVIEDEMLTDLDLLRFSPVSANLNFSVNGVPNLACFLKFKEGRKVINKLKKSLDSEGIMIPRKVFQIVEKPLNEFHGHEGEILDISWSNNGLLLSSSIDKTARMWKVGCSQCLRVFPHHDFVTCAQFNPMDDSYFISGSIDGIVRLWDIQRGQVIDWIDIKEIVTAICYRPDGKGGIVGSMVGNCSFFEIADDFLHQVSVIYLQDKKTLTCKRITGFQFSPNNPSEVVVSSADSLVRILKGADIICKLRGSLPLIDRGSQVFASFTADGKHVISATDDSNVYIWNHLNKGRITNNKPKNVWSCESFLSQNAIIAVPWHGITSTSALPPSTPRQPTSTSKYNQKSPVSSSYHTVNHAEVSSMKSSATARDCEALLRSNQADISPAIGDMEYEFLKNVCEGVLSGSHMWGLVIVTAGKDGRIRTYHNYGLPVRYPTRKFSLSNIRNRCRENCSNIKGSTSLGR